jgi:hypothetical protein
MLIITSPFLVLVRERGAVEGLVWIIASLGGLIWDVSQIRRRLPTAAG